MHGEIHWSDGCPFGYVELPFRPVEAVFRMQEKADIDDQISRVSGFLEEVGETTLNSLSMEEVAYQARARGLSPKTVTLIENLVEIVS